MAWQSSSCTNSISDYSTSHLIPFTMRYFFSVLMLVFLLSCSTHKVTEVNVTNENDYSIAVTVAALNCRQTFSHIKPHSEFSGLFDWTTIVQGEAQWVFLITNENTGGVDSFSHGYFTNGELFGFADLVSKGSELKVKISE